MQKFDVIIIGAGTGGLRTAFLASHTGAKVGLVEPSILGGTCLNFGCIPTKAMLHAAHLFKAAKNKTFGITTTPKLSYPKLMNRVQGIIKEGQDHIKKSIKNNKHITVIKGKAKFTSKLAIKVGNKEYSAKKFIIATGSRNNIVPIEGLEKNGFLTNEQLIYGKKLPKSVIMIGGGYIAVEFATFFNELGVDVNIIEHHHHILGILDHDVSEYLEEMYKKRGMKITACADTKTITKKGKKKIATIENRDTHKKIKKSAEEIFVATGRIPNIDLDLKKAGVKLGKRKNIEINDKLQTSNKNIYAIGDVTGKAMFAHAVKREAQIVVDNALNGKNKKMPFDLVPWSVFTDPPIAGIGLSERQCKQKKIPYVVEKAQFSRTGRAKIIDEAHGFVKIMHHKKTKKILGAVMIGPGVDNLMHEIAVIMNTKEPTITTLHNTIHVHPTLAEVYDNLYEVEPLENP